LIKILKVEKNFADTGKITNFAAPFQPGPIATATKAAESNKNKPQKTDKIK